MKKISVILLILLMTLLQLPSLKADAATNASELKLNTVLTQWVLDEPTNTLYAISNSGKSLLFINGTTMSVEKTLTLNGTPTDIISDNGNLYVALDDINQIVVVDAASRTITKSINTSADACRIVKDGDKIYYTQGNQWCGIYEYNLSTSTDRQLQINLSTYNPDLAINTTDHMLYIGESGSSDSNMIYYSTSEDKVVGQTTHDNGHGLEYASKYTLFDGERVYYAGYAFDKLNPTILGKYYDDNSAYQDRYIIFAKYGVAFTRTKVYNSETYELLSDSGANIDLYEISNKGIFYFYSQQENSILKVDNNKNGWVQESGKWYYYDMGEKKTGWLHESNNWYFLNNDGSMATGWINQGGNWYYLVGSGEMKTGWISIGGVWYYLASSGEMKTGWVSDGGSWYYLASSGAMKTGWVLDGKDWYYLYKDGRMAANTTIDGYKLGKSGAWIH